MQQLIVVLHVLLCFAIIGLVLLQHGKGADVGATFGGGSSNTMFGSAGTVPFLMKVTAACAALFFVTSLTLGLLARGQTQQHDTTYELTAPPTQQSLPGTPPQGPAK